MENFPSDSDLRNLVKELAQGRDLAKQLRLHLNAQSSSSSSSSSHESREFLLQRIVHSYDQALSILTHAHAHPPPPAGEAPPPADSPPRSLAGSPHSDDSDQDFKDQASRKRNKEVARWSEKIQVRPEAGIEGQLDDGYSWRKYGQKDILGAKHPRGYYRCTYRHSQGCLAAKQVQRSDDDPTVFEITYRRKHTCNPRAPNSNNAPNHQDPNPLTQQQNPPQNEPFFSIQTSLRLISTQAQAQAQDENNPSISSSSSYSFHPLLNFPSASSSTINNNNNNNNPQNNQLPFSYYNPISTNDMNDDYGGLIPNLNNSSDSELTPIVAPITSSTTNSATDFPFATSSGFASNFSFGNPGYYP